MSRALAPPRSLYNFALLVWKMKEQRRELRDWEPKLRKMKLARIGFWTGNVWEKNRYVTLPLQCYFSCPEFRSFVHATYVCLSQFLIFFEYLIKKLKIRYSISTSVDYYSFPMIIIWFIDLECLCSKMSNRILVSPKGSNNNWNLLSIFPIFFHESSIYLIIGN